MPYERVSRNPQLNFQINRVLTYGPLSCDYDEVVSALALVRRLEEWFPAWLKLAEKAEREKRFLHAAYAYRMAEFFLKETHPRKREMYEKSISHFYRAFDEMSLPYTVHNIPYKGTTLHSVKISAPDSHQTILVCGGYDSFIEEFIPAVMEIARMGYSIVFFEGDGQGKTLQNGLPFIHAWEEPTCCVLNYYHLQSCPMIGISWGGYLAMRAAAYEPRVSAVVAYDVADNGYEVVTHLFPPLMQKLIGAGIIKNKAVWVNRVAHFAMRKSVLADWMFSQGQYITHTNSPYAFLKEVRKHSLAGISDKIVQDCLLLAGEKDHYIPRVQFERLKKNLPQAHSVKSRMFTQAEGGEQHCQIGNHQLAVHEIVCWLSGLTSAK